MAEQEPSLLEQTLREQADVIIENVAPPGALPLAQVLGTAAFFDERQRKIVSENQASQGRSVETVDRSSRINVEHVRQAFKTHRKQNDK